MAERILIVDDEPGILHALQRLLRHGLSAPDGSRQYSAFGDTTIGQEAARVRADVIEEDVTPGRTLHVEGELTCGRNAAG